jgi:hypothetical protein
MVTGDFEVIERDGMVFAPHIPLFDAHTRDGVEFDQARLQTIADNCNRRIADTGDLSPLVAGHASEETPETDRPVIGWASNFTVGTWGVTEPRPCIFADLQFTTEQWAIAKTLPRRSVELWYPQEAERSFIDPIALLSATTPHRDFGLLYKKKKDKSNTYIYKISGGSLDKDEMLKCFAEMLENSDVGKYVRSQMKAEEKPADEDKEDDDKEVDAEEDNKDEDRDEKEDEGKYKLKSEQANRKYARLESEHKLLASRLADLERRERLANRKADLLGIEAEGILFDMSEELDTVSDLEPAKYAKHLDKMRTRYSRSPIGVRVNVASVPAHGTKAGDDTFSPEQVRLAAEYMISGKAQTNEEAFNMVRIK